MPPLDAAQLAARARIAHERLRACDLCPRGCGVDRTNGELGFCRVGARAIVASYGPHFGEERPLVGRRGSGTVFFSGCNLACEFCQNEEISHGLAGGETTSEELAAIFLAVQRSGCHNLNLVTPTHVVPQWLDALAQARAHGFDLPVVYNTGGYDRVDTLQLLDGAVDIYLPDYKFTDEAVAARLAHAPDYPTVAQAALREMHRQTGDLEIDATGVAQRGLLVRHLVMPNDLAGSRAAMRFLAREISASTYVNIMGQYHPCHHAHRYENLRRRPTMDEMQAADDAAREYGLTRVDNR